MGVILQKIEYYDKHINIYNYYIKVNITHYINININYNAS
jgi:hypothetical protein